MLYIFLRESVRLTPGQSIRLSHVAQVKAVGCGAAEASQRALGVMGQGPLLVTAGQIAEALGREDLRLYGASACAVLPREKPPKPGSVALRTALVCLLLFFGGAMTVLSYQTDTSMPDAHEALATVLTGDGQNTGWITIPYCVGVGLGVLFFSGLLRFGKSRQKPTLFELEQQASEEEYVQYLASQAEEAP